MGKYRIVKHQAGKDIIGYSPEIWESRPYNSENCTTWWKLAGNEQLISQDRWIASLPKTIEEAKLIIEQHIEDQKPRYSEEVVYEYDLSDVRTGENIESWVNEKEGYFFTPEQLNEYTANVIKDALNTAAENAYVDFEDYDKEFVNKKSITKTFEETFQKYKL